MNEQATQPDQHAFWKDGAIKGGRYRAHKLDADKRREIARKAANTRWKTRQALGGTIDLPKAEFQGKLEIGELVLPCAVLDNGVRVLSERGVTKALGGKRGGSHWERRRLESLGSYLPVFMSANNLVPYMSPSLRVALSQPVLYRVGNGIGYGVLATLIPEICEVWLKARRGGVLTPSQEHIAATAEVLTAALARVGIIALVDEVTGYQKVRDRHELHRILEAYIAKELLPWTKLFPDDFYKELFRLRGWQYSPPNPKRPKFVGKLTNELVYSKLPSGVLDELRHKNPVVRDGWRRHKHFQFLTEDVGHPHLEKQLIAVVTLMRASPSWATFYRLFNRAFGGIQGEFVLEGLEKDD